MSWLLLIPAALIATPVLFFLAVAGGALWIMYENEKHQPGGKYSLEPAESRREPPMSLRAMFRMTLKVTLGGDNLPGPPPAPQPHLHHHRGRGGCARKDRPARQGRTSEDE